MQYLKITHTNGTATYYPGTTTSIIIAAPVLSGNVVVNKGRVTNASYNKIVAGSMTYVTDSVAPYTGSNEKYELGELAHDGVFTVAHSN